MSLFDSTQPSRIIAIEEHFATMEFFEGPGRVVSAAGTRPFGRRARSRGGRIEAMDRAAVDLQILSLNDARRRSHSSPARRSISR